MSNEQSTQRGGAVSLIRVMIGTTAAIALSLALTVGPASAKPVYDYVYSGEYFDGSTSEKGPFPQYPTDIAYDDAAERLLISVGSPGFVTPGYGYLSKFTKSGIADPFAASGFGDTITMAAGNRFSQFSRIAIDNTGGPHDGNVYVASVQSFPNYVHGFRRDGTSIAGIDELEGNVCGVGVDPQGNVWVQRSSGFNGDAELWEYDADGGFHDVKIDKDYAACMMTMDGKGNFYWNKKSIGTSTEGTPWKLAPDGEELYNLSPITNSQAFGIDYSNDDVFVLEGTFSEQKVTQYDKNGAKLGTFGLADPGHSFLGLTERSTGIAIDPVTHDVWIANHREYGGAYRIEKFIRSGPITIPTTTTDAPTLNTSNVTLRGTINAENIETTDCHFEWGTTPALGITTPCEEGNSFNGPENHAVSAEIKHLNKGTRYYVKLFSQNANGRIADGGYRIFYPQAKPILNSVGADHINTDGVRLIANIDPNGGKTSYQFEWGTDESYGSASKEKKLAVTLDGEEVDNVITGLTPNTTYHYRIVVTNEAGAKTGEDRTFTTFATDPTVDPCPNRLVRQQTEASLLLDCRAYELVSAANAGGYDVESDLTPGQVPLISSPLVNGRLLYSIHSGLVPGIAGNPTNYGRDPYVATRGARGWRTEYVGLPANGMAQQGPFGSPLLGLAPMMDRFAFGGEGICDPCFEDGSTNIPLRFPNGEIVKGMAGDLSPAADPSQHVIIPFSADGSHFVFGSNQKFESAGSEAGSIYVRDLNGSGTEVASTLPGGGAITGGELTELDISEHGDRVVVGKHVSSEGENDYRHLYMHLAGSANSVDLNPSPTQGALFAGMTADGSQVFLATKDKLLAEDTDESTDIYEVEVDGAGAPNPRLISTQGGVPSNDDGCEPAGEPDQWNAASGEGNCGAVPFAGSAGLAEQGGTFYFMSPELLDGSEGEANEVNLYAVAPNEDPRFVATIDSSAAEAPPPPPNHPVVSSSLTGSLSAPESLTVDQSTGDIYAVERTAGKVSRWTSAGAPDEFTEGPSAGTNAISGLTLGNAGRSQVAVDNSGSSPFSGGFYVKMNGTTVGVYSATGKELGTLTGFGEVCGIAADPSGVLYVGDRTSATVRRLVPTSGSTPVSKAANYTETGLKPEGINQPCHVAADGIGQVYVAQAVTGPLKVFDVAEFDTVPPTVGGPVVSTASNDATVDPGTDELYVDEGGQIARYDSSQNLIQKFGGGNISNSRGVAVNASNRHIYSSSGSNIVEFGVEAVPYVPMMNPAVVHATQQADVHSFEDFQVTPDGEYAAFSSITPLTGYPNAGHSEIYRYEPATSDLDCASCAPTNSIGQNDVLLSKYGLNLADDGRVFFTSGDGLVLRDTNEQTDAYEWRDGVVQLISTGASGEPSELLSASADGKDAFFFTRQVLVHEDENGNAIKVYDAREDGGYLYDRPPFPCAASDECHGAGTEAPSPPSIPTITGAGDTGYATESNRSCTDLPRARSNAARARRLRRLASRSKSRSRSRALRKRAARAARKASSLRRRARACRRANRGNG